MYNFLNNFAGFTQCDLGNSEINSGIMTVGIIVHLVLLAVIFSDRKSEDNISDQVKQSRIQWRRQKGSIVGVIFALIGIAMTHGGGIDYCEENISWLPFLGFLILYIVIFGWSFFSNRFKE